MTQWTNHYIDEYEKQLDVVENKFGDAFLDSEDRCRYCEEPYGLHHGPHCPKDVKC